MASLNVLKATSAAPNSFRRSKRHGVCAALPNDAVAAASLPQLLPLDEDYKVRHAFTPYAAWLVPGRVMLGRYPFIEPNRCLTRATGELQIEQILGAGINTFVSLQGDVPSQEKMPIGGVDGFYPYKSTADMIAASLSDLPPSEIVEGLRNPYLDQFVPPRRREASAAYTNYKPIRPSYAHFPIVDITDMEVMNTIADALTLRLTSGEKMYIHCFGGRGRAGLVGACLLVRAYGISGEEALERVQSSFDTRATAEERLSPQSEKQVKLVMAYAASRA